MIRESIFSVLLLAGFLQFNSHGQEAIEPQSLFPGNGAFEGWNRMDSDSEYSGETMEDWLGAMTDLYLEYGVERIFVARYVDEKATKITLETFWLKEPASAWGLLTMNSSGKGTPDTLGDVSVLYDHYVHLVKGACYIKSTTSRKTEASIQTIRQMGSYAAARIDQNAKKPALLLALELDNEPIMYGKFFKGQRGLAEIIDFGHGSVAGFMEGAVVRKEAVYHFAFRYKDERSRREWFASAKGKMKMNQRFSDYTMQGEGFTVLDRNNNTFTFEPYKNYILVVKNNDPVAVGQTFKRMRSNLERLIR
jgi:hypothetical protein